MFDELNHLDEEKLLALEKIIRHKEQVAKFYGKKVKEKTFRIGDLVWKVILPPNKKSMFYGKWSPNWEGPYEVERVFSNNAYAVREVEGNNRIQTINRKYLKKYRPMIHEVSINYSSESNCLDYNKKEKGKILQDQKGGDAFNV